MSTTNSSLTVEPYLSFDGCCEEAIEFYRKSIGANVELLLRFKDSPDPEMCPPGENGSKIMHTSFYIGKTRLMASDGRCQGRPNFHGFSLSLTAANEAEADRLFVALSDGGEVHMPLARTFFSPYFGMVSDRFGLCWMIIVEPPQRT
jgi:PhnB protein